MAQCSLEIRLKRASKEYAEGEVVSGNVVITSPTNQPIQHNGITLTLEGIVNINLSQKSIGVFEAFYNSAKPTQLIAYTLELSKAGKFTTSKVEIPFEIPLKSKGKPLYETYHGVFINIQVNYFFKHVF
jgi:flavorubredoxin